MDPATLATTAVAILSPYLAKFGEHAVDKLGDEAPELGGKLFAWLRRKLGGHGQEAMNDLVKKPDNELNQADLSTQLAKALEADPAFARELIGLLPEGAAEAGAMTLNVSGAGAKAAQVKGSGNTTTVS